jgi:hypothetical protein
MPTITVYAYMEDFDNSELPMYEWQQQLEDAVIEYNDNYLTRHNPHLTFLEYCAQKKYKYKYR